MEQGDIVWADDKEKHPHPIIFIEKIDKHNFHGCIFSHEIGKGNVKMKPEHFEKQDENGNPYDIQYDNSYLVICRLIKLGNWITRDKPKGKLTEEGIRFILANIPTEDKAILLNKPIWELNS